MKKNRHWRYNIKWSKLDEGKALDDIIYPWYIEQNKVMQSINDEIPKTLWFLKYKKEKD